jgi:hypothetical protein
VVVSEGFVFEKFFEDFVFVDFFIPCLFHGWKLLTVRAFLIARPSHIDFKAFVVHRIYFKGIFLDHFVEMFFENIFPCSSK